LLYILFVRDCRRVVDNIALVLSLPLAKPRGQERFLVRFDDDTQNNLLLVSASTTTDDAETGLNTDPVIVAATPTVVILTFMIKKIAMAMM
jgi:hypothetical protein